MNFMENEDSFIINKNTEGNKAETRSTNRNNNKLRAINFIFSSNNKLFKKESQPSQTNSQLNIPPYKREILFKLTSFSHEKQKVMFSNGIEEIFDDSKNSGEDKFIFNLSNKKYSTPPKNTKSSYRKTKEHIKTPYKTTKSHSTRNKSKKSKNNNKNDIRAKSSNYWKSLLFDFETINNNISQDFNIDNNQACNSVIMENPFNNKIEYKLLFYNNNFREDNEEELNNSI